jgi:hypothetical protein
MSLSQERELAKAGTTVLVPTFKPTQPNPDPPKSNRTSIPVATLTDDPSLACPSTLSPLRHCNHTFLPPNALHVELASYAPTTTQPPGHTCSRLSLYRSIALRISNRRDSICLIRLVDRFYRSGRSLDWASNHQSWPFCSNRRKIRATMHCPGEQGHSHFRRFQVINSNRQWYQGQRETRRAGSDDTKQQRQQLSEFPWGAGTPSPEHGSGSRERSEQESQVSR